MIARELNEEQTSDPQFPLRKKIGTLVGTAFGSVLVLLLYTIWYFEKELGAFWLHIFAFTIAVQMIVVFSAVMCYVHETESERALRYKKHGLVYAPENSVSASGLAKAVLSALSISTYVVVMIFPYLIVAAAMMVLEIGWFILAMVLRIKRASFCEAFLTPWVMLVISVGQRIYYQPSERHLIG